MSFVYVPIYAHSFNTQALSRTNVNEKKQASPQDIVSAALQATSRLSDMEKAEALGVTHTTIGRWKAGYGKEGGWKTLHAGTRRKLEDYLARMRTKENAERSTAEFVGATWLDWESRAAERRARAAEIEAEAARERAVAARLAEENARDLRSALSSDQLARTWADAMLLAEGMRQAEAEAAATTNGAPESTDQSQPDA